MEIDKAAAREYDFSAARAAMQRYVDRELLAGISHAVLRGRTLVEVACAGWADRERRVPRWRWRRWPTIPRRKWARSRWGGIAGTQWWISPRSGITVLMMAQRHMAFWHPFALEFKRLAYQAMGRWGENTTPPRSDDLSF